MTRWALVMFLTGLAGAQGLPDNEGLATYERVCGACHGADIVIGMHQTREGWTELVQSMRERGASGSEAEFTTIVNYLVRNFPAQSAPANFKLPSPRTRREAARAPGQAVDSRLRLRP